MKRKNRFSKLVFSLNGLLFLMGGLVLLGESKIVFGIIQVAAAIINVAMIPKLKNEKAKSKLNYAVLAMNVVVCFSIAVDNVLLGKAYIQYVWFLASLISLVALILKVKEKKKLAGEI